MMMIRGSASTAIHDVLVGAVRPAEWLGVCDSALYLRTPCSTVLAVVTHDAVRLPCAIVLPSTAAQLSLSQAAPPPAHRNLKPTVGNGRIEWTGSNGPVTVSCTRLWAPPRISTGVPDRAALEWLRRCMAGRDIELEPARIAALARAQSPLEQRTAAAGLLGRGPGLTPSGDDVLSGFLLGALAFGRDASVVTQTVTEQASQVTTAISAQLLRHAARGECVPQLAEVIASVTGHRTAPGAAERLLAVGHTSGAALAHGLLAAAGSGPLHPRRPARRANGALSVEWREIPRDTAPLAGSTTAARGCE